MASTSEFQIFCLVLGIMFSLTGRLVMCGFWYVFRSIIVFVVVRLRGSGRKLMSSNHFLDEDGSLPISHNILVSFQIEGTLSLELFTRLFLERCIHVGEFPELEEKIVVCYGYPFWMKNDEFEINNHILDGNELMRRTLGLSHLELDQTILNEQFHGHEQSPWKIYIVHESPEFTRLIFCFHHSLGDGRSLYNVLMRVAHTSNPDASILVTPRGVSKTEMVNTNPKSKKPNPSALDILRPSSLIREFAKCQPYPSFYVQNQSEDGRVQARSSRLPLNDLKGMSQRQGLPLTALLLTAITGALRKYLSRNQLNISDWVFCPMPIPLETHAPGLTNAIQSVCFTLPFAVETLEERLVECKKSVERAQTSGAFPTLIKLNTAIENCYPLRLKPKSAGMPPLVLTSFPGPKSTIYFCNKVHAVTDMHFAWSGVKYLSVIFTTLSYKDGIRITLSADKNAFQSQGDGEVVMELLEEEVKLMISMESQFLCKDNHVIPLD